MSDKYAGFVVGLDKDLRSDEVQATLNAIKMIRGVIVVEPVVTTATLHIAQGRAAREFEKKLLDTFFPE